MAKIPMVTRTMKSTVATIMTVNIPEEKTENVEYKVPRTYKDSGELLKVAKFLYETDTTKLIHVIDSHTETQLYGMPESDFLTYAHPIEKNTKEN